MLSDRKSVFLVWLKCGLIRLEEGKERRLLISEEYGKAIIKEDNNRCGKERKEHILTLIPLTSKCLFSCLR